MACRCSLKSAISKTLAILSLSLSGWAIHQTSVFAADVSCYMITSSGMALSLDHLCGTNVAVGAASEPAAPLLPDASLPMPYAPDLYFSIPLTPRAVSTSGSPHHRDVNRELPVLWPTPQLPQLPSPGFSQLEGRSLVNMPVLF
jgi:hypothetical protein